MFFLHLQKECYTNSPDNKTQQIQSIKMQNNNTIFGWFRRTVDGAWIGLNTKKVNKNLHTNKSKSNLRNHKFFALDLIR